MGIDEKLLKIEKLTKEIELEKSFDKIVAKFSEAAGVIKQVLSETKAEKGKVLEIIRELDTFIEKDLKIDDDVE